MKNKLILLLILTMALVLLLAPAALAQGTPAALAQVAPAAADSINLYDNAGGTTYTINTAVASSVPGVYDYAAEQVNVDDGAGGTVAVLIHNLQVLVSAQVSANCDNVYIQASADLMLCDSVMQVTSGRVKPIIQLTDGTTFSLGGDNSIYDTAHATAVTNSAVVSGGYISLGGSGRLYASCADGGGAVIGSAAGSNCTIEVMGGFWTLENAAACEGACLGAGSGAEATITISGGWLNITNNGLGAGIGGSNNSTGNNSINISNGSVHVKNCNAASAAIGSGATTVDNTSISISGGSCFAENTAGLKFGSGTIPITVTNGAVPVYEVLVPGVFATLTLGQQVYEASPASVANFGGTGYNLTNCYAHNDQNRNAYFYLPAGTYNTDTTVTNPHGSSLTYVVSIINGLATCEISAATVKDLGAFSSAFNFASMASDGITVTLGADIGTAAVPAAVDEFTYLRSPATLDTGGFSLYANQEGPLVILEQSAELTIEGGGTLCNYGNFFSMHGSSCIVEIGASSRLTVNGGTLKSGSVAIVGGELGTSLILSGVKLIGGFAGNYIIIP